MLHARKADETLLIHSMGKPINVLAIADTNDEANAYMEKHRDAAVIACFGPYVFLADRYDR